MWGIIVLYVDRGGQTLIAALPVGAALDLAPRELSLFCQIITFLKSSTMDR